MKNIPDAHMRARAEEADRILSGPVFSDAMERARRQFYRDWIAAKDVADREAAWAATRALDEVQRQLRRIINQGTVAGAE